MQEEKALSISCLLMACTRTALQINQRVATPQVSKGRQSFLYVTYHMSLIYMAIKIHHDGQG